MYFIIQIRNSIFPDGVRPIVKWADDGVTTDGMLLHFHYPGQFSTVSWDPIDKWDPIINKTKNTVMYFTITGLDVMKQRNKPNKTCIEDWRHYDEILRDFTMSRAGCKPPYLTTSKNMTLCASKQQMKKFNIRKIHKTVSSTAHPCNSVQDIQYKYTEAEWNNSFAGEVSY